MTRRLATHMDLGVGLCQALGLEPHLTKSITLTIDVADGGFAHVEVTGFVPDVSTGAVLDEVRRYVLVDEEAL